MGVAAAGELGWTVDAWSLSEGATDDVTRGAVDVGEVSTVDLTSPGASPRGLWLSVLPEDNVTAGAAVRGGRATGSTNSPSSVEGSMMAARKRPRECCYRTKVSL